MGITDDIQDAQPQVTLCVSFCESAGPRDSADTLLDLLTRTCQEAGFPHCERLYVGSYFCENYFAALSDDFHEAVRALCRTYDMGATLVVPIIGQAFLQRVEGRLADVLDRFGDVYDEVVANDAAEYLLLASSTQKRMGLGRLFSKEQRDARYVDLRERTCTPTLSPEALECLQAGDDVGPTDAVDQASQAETADRTQDRLRPLIEVDPVAAVVDVSVLLQAAPDAEIAIHLPYCYATTGRNCGPASTFEPDSEKFRLGRGCGRHCLRMSQGVRTEEGIDYVKHGRTYYFANPTCSIAGTGSWRIIYSAAHQTMRLP